MWISRGIWLVIKKIALKQTFDAGEMFRPYRILELDDAVRSETIQPFTCHQMVGCGACPMACVMLIRGLLESAIGQIAL